MNRDESHSGNPEADPDDESAAHRGRSDGWTLPYFVPFGWPSLFRPSDEVEPDSPAPDDRDTEED